MASQTQKMFPTDVAGSLAGTDVVLDRFGGHRHGKVMRYQHYGPAYTVPVCLDDGRWTAATKAELEQELEPEAPVESAPPPPQPRAARKRRKPPAKVTEGSTSAA